MKSIKYKLLISFCIIATISITILGVVISWKLGQSILDQSEKLTSDLTTRTYKALHGHYQILVYDIQEDIRRTADSLYKNPTIAASLEFGQIPAMKALLEQTARGEGLDFAMLFTVTGRLQASFPGDIDDIEVEKYFNSWEPGIRAQRFLTGEAADSLTRWDAIAKHDVDTLKLFGLGDRDISAEGALSVVSAGIIEDDFGDPIGIGLVGKLLNGYDEPLKHFYDMLGSASVIYLDTIAIAHAGFGSNEDKSFDRSTLQIRPEVQTDLYKTEGIQNLVLTLAEKDYLSTCSALRSLDDKKIGILCVGVPESEIIETQQVILSSGNDTRKSVQEWILGIGLISLILFAIMSVIIATKIVVPIQQISAHAKRIARGSFQQPTIIRVSKDEIGELSRSLTQVAASFQDITTTSEAIASGNLRHKVTPRSDQDTLGHALQSMSTYLNQMASVAETIAKGDLTVTIHVRSADDVFGQAIQSMTEGLHSLIAQIRTSAEVLSSTGTDIVSLTVHNSRIAGEVSNSVENMISTMQEIGTDVKEVAHNMGTLSSSVEETFAAMAQMASSITQIASNTTDLAYQSNQTIESLEGVVTSLEEVTESTDISKQLAQGTIRDALEGQQAVEQMMTSIETIQQTVTTAMDAITQFAQRSRDIDTILEVIRNITEQTSLLALNASIIAAQAGAHGRGFAVVADEIKNLADGVGTSTKDIATIVHTLQQDTNRVVQTIQEGVVEVNQGMEKSQQAREVLRKIITSDERSSSVVTEVSDTVHELMTTGHGLSTAMGQVNRMTNDITAATNEQKGSTRQINQAIGHINDMSSQIRQVTTKQLDGVTRVLDITNNVTVLIEKNLESSQQIAHTTDELSSQADILRQSVDRFKLSS